MVELGQKWEVDGAEAGARVSEPLENPQIEAAAGDKPIFFGSYIRSVDSKGRFSLPFRFRRAGESEKYVLLDLPGSLRLFPHAEYHRRLGRTLEGLSTTERWDHTRFLSYASCELEPDRQGRVMVPQHFLARAGVQSKVQVLGMGNFMELWEPQGLERRLAASPPPSEAFTNEFLR